MEANQVTRIFDASDGCDELINNFMENWVETTGQNIKVNAVYPFIKNPPEQYYFPSETGAIVYDPPKNSLFVVFDCEVKAILPKWYLKLCNKMK